VDTLVQGYNLIESMDDCTYVSVPTHVKASSIGAHYRHHLEHVQILLQNLHDTTVDYDCRPRSCKIEQDRQFALCYTQKLIEQIKNLTEHDLDKTLVVAHRTCTQDETRCAPSTLRREILFLVSHTIHHYALIKLIAESFGAHIHKHFGVMPSTLVHLNQN